MISTCLIFSFYYSPSSLSGQKELLSNEMQRITGTILSEVETTNVKTSFVFHASSNTEDILVTYFKPTNETASSTYPTSWKTGAICQIEGVPELPTPSENPGQFNYQDYLKKQSINYQLTIAKVSDLKCTGSSSRQAFFSLRNNIITHIDEKMSGFSSAWTQALLLGQDTLIEETTIELFQRWNLSHLLAISGLHVGLITSFVYFLLIKTGMLTKEKAFFLLLLLLIIYPFISGGAPSVWRAVLTTSLGMIFLKYKSKLGLIDTISIVFFICVVADKQIVYQLGFQFSFLVTLALLLSKSYLTKNNGMVGLLFRISFISLISVLPIQIAHFYFLNPLALLLNILVVTYFTIIVMPALFTLFFSVYTFPVLIKIIDPAFMHVHQFVLAIIEWIDKVFYYPWVIGEFPYYYFVPYYVGLFFLFSALDKEKLRLALLHGTLLVGLLVWISCRPYLNPNGSVTMLDIGQGDAIIMELPYRKGVIVMDVAGKMENDFKTPSNRTYKQVIKPYLYSRGITNIDIIFLSHADHDHIGSLPYLLADFSVQRVVTSPYFSPPNDLSNVMKEERVHIDRMGKNDRLIIDKQQFFVVHPQLNYQSKNDNSLVLFTEIGSLTWLFTGDISESVESEITNQYPDIEVDVLKVAHHGSLTSTSSNFIETVKPEIALISVGKNNRYNHPHETVIKRLQNNNVIIYRTDKQGAIQYTFKNNGERGTFSSFSP